MVKEHLLDDQAKRLGLAVSKEELNDLVHGESISPLLQQLPLFVNPETGMFDRSTLVSFLATISSEESTLPVEQLGMVRQYKSIWLFIENLIKYQRLEEKYGHYCPQLSCQMMLRLKLFLSNRSKGADILYTVQNYYTIPDSVANDAIQI